MKILFWQWNAFMQKGIENAFKKMNVDYDVFNYRLNDWEHDDKFIREFSEKLYKNYDAVFSVNYCPLISMVCEEKNIKYISWVYDSPIHIRDISSFNNRCNSIFFFDRGQVEKYANDGYKNVYHMPLAVDENVWKFEQKTSKWECDVAFVGQLYQSDFSYLMGPLDMYYRGLFDGFVNVQKKLAGAYLLDELITDDLIKQINLLYEKASKGGFLVGKAEMEYTCACEATGRERFEALALLSERYKVNLYSDNKDERLPKINQCGYVDYYTQMPQVFRNAAINLNISLKTIRTGIPLRVFDILGCGGFLITNYQEELFDFFEPGVDLVVYEDLKDLVLKVDYYLRHEEERKAIAENGRKKAKESCSFISRLEKIFNQE